MTINLYFGDTSDELANAAKTADPLAFLIDHSNYREFLNSQPDATVTVYTSPGDLPKVSTDNFAIYQLLDLADNIYYVTPSSHSDNNNQLFFESVLLAIKQQKNNVYNLDLSKYSTQAYTNLVSSRQSNDLQLWVAGCSMSHGVGVDASQRYGQVLADTLGLPVSFLTAGGASISWAVDQIVRSDIQKGDIVILGVTEEVRFPYWMSNNEVWHITPTHQNQNHQLAFTNLTTNIIDRLITDNNCFYQSIIRLHQLVNFCNKIDVKLLIFGLLSSPSLAVHLNNISNFVYYTNFKSPTCYIDLGTDNRHPGPKQHQLYADFCQAALKQFNYI
jgi:hypothetical protein